MYLLYNFLLFLALIGSTPWWLLQMLRHGKYRTGWRERLGFVPERLLHRGSENTIWVHAVSVGEVQAISRVIQELRARLPEWRIVVSTTTDTGQRLARERYGQQNVFYLPLDLSFAVRAYFERLRPQMLVLAESEFWPNLLRWARLSGASVAVVNARVSDRSLPGYLRFRGVLRRVMQNVDLLLAQSEEDARRLAQIGAPEQRIRVSGNLKFEITPPRNSDLAERFHQALRRAEVGPLIVAGSTLDPEEADLLQMFTQVAARHPKALLVIAPRHPERFDAVASLLESSEIAFQRRSRWDGEALIAGSVFLLDTIGELASLYGSADLAFVGGSLVPRGGHNVLEAAQFAKPVLVGPSTENFRDIVELFRRSDALRVVTLETLTPTVLQLLEDDQERSALGRRALEVMRSQLGATETTVNALLELLAERAPLVTTSPEGRA